MRSYSLRAIVKTAIRGAGVLLFGAGIGSAQTTVNLTAGPTSLITPDGASIPMWGYACGSGNTAGTCRAANPNGSGWSPVILTVPTGSSLTVVLTNSLQFSNGNGVPTSLTIVGQLGGGLGDKTQRTTTTSPDHSGAQGASTWPIANNGNAGTPPSQGPRVQSFATEVAPGETKSLPAWSSLKPGTYLLESGTHPSIQATMGLIGMVVVTSAPASGAQGTAYPAAGSAAPAVNYDAEVPLLLSEIDPLQNKTVSAAVNTLNFSETAVWSGQSGSCGNPTSPNYLTCYPPTVNYKPLYYLINGVAFNKTSATNSLFATAPATGITAGTGQVLVRLVNAGSRMHVPSIVGSATTVNGVSGASTSGGFSLIAEDGNRLPGTPRIQSEVFMAAGKTVDVMVNAPTSATPAALAIYDRELSLSGNGTARDAGMLAYISINGGTLPSAANQTAVANPDTYNYVVPCAASPCQPVSVSDPGKGVIANDVNVLGVKVSVAPTQGTVILSPDGTFSYTPNPGWTGSDHFTYQANGNGPTAVVTLGAAAADAAGGITFGDLHFTANTATAIRVPAPGLLMGAKDAAGYPLKIVASSVTPNGTFSLVVDEKGGFNANVPSAGTYTFSFKAQSTYGTVSATQTATVTFPTANGPHITVLDGQDKATPITDYRWIIEEDRTFYVDPTKTTNTGGTTSTTVVPTFGTNFHTSYMPIVATGCTGPNSCESGQTLGGQDAACDLGNGICRTGAGIHQTPVDPSLVHLDPHKRYYISVLPGDAANAFNTGNAQGGHGMGGAPIGIDPVTHVQASSVTVYTQPNPYPPSKLSVFVFEDDFPLNGEQDAGGGVDILALNEPGLGQFNIEIFDDAGGSGDATGQVNYDMFNQPLSNSLAGTIDPATNADACPISTQVTGNMTQNGGDGSQKGITGMIVTCPKYEADGKTLSPLAGQAVVANMMPGRYGIVATPAADRIARGEEWLQTNTLDGQKALDSFLKIGEAGYFQEYGPASYHVAIGFANPKIINARKAGVCNGSDINITGANCTNTLKGMVTSERMSRTPDERLYSSGDYSAFSFTQCYVSFGDPDGEDFAFTKCNADGTFQLDGLPDGNWRVTVFDQWDDFLVDGLSTPVMLSGGKVTDMGQLATSQWHADIYTTTFFDDNGDGVRQDSEKGLALIPTNIRFRDGSFSNFNSTDLDGVANFNEEFPLFSWYVVETDATRYKNTGTHVVYDAGGPSDGSTCGGTGANATAPCGNSSVGHFMANTYEQNPLPGNLHVPGAVYCNDADCTNQSIKDGPNTAVSPTSTGRIDPPWVLTEAWQGFAGQSNFLEFGKTPYVPGENGGIRGHVVYASTRPFDDPQMLDQLSWEPLIPNVTVNLYQEKTAPDGSTSLTLVDTTKTSSWDDWAQGFRSDGVPNMNCPGQGKDTGPGADPYFFFTLDNQPNYLDLYKAQHPGDDTYNANATPMSVPYNSQFKCYDGMHNWNQLQPAPYDGMYQFPSVTGMDPVTGKPTGTNCTMCTTNPDQKDAYRYGTAMLPQGKYVVEVVPPPGYELVKEEDKNILIGDSFLAPATVEFPGLGGSVYILPDQATIAEYYNPNNPQNATTNLGRTTLPSHESDTGIAETYWPCVGELRQVPDYISLFPQSGEVAPFAGAYRNLCDRKEVTLDDQTSSQAKFYLFTSTHAAAHFTGIITDDFTSEFDPFSPQFGEKFSPPNLPVAIKDWTGTETQRIYSDQWGAYNGLTYSTWEVNPPNPTGYSPQMMVTCMNDPGTASTPDPLFNPGYSDFCYEIPFMPAQTQYMDTPVTPTTAFSEGYNHPDCAYPDATPAVSRVDGDGDGPWVASSGKGYVTSVAVTNQGSGYTGTPTVTFGAAPAGGTRAVGTAVISGSVINVAVSNGGRGYTSAPNVTFGSPARSGTAATGTAVMTGSVKSVSISNGGSGYVNNPTVTFGAPPAGGVRATGTATRNNATRRITGVTITNPGSGYLSAPTVSFSGGGGTGAAASSSLAQSVKSVTITNAGSGYTSAPSISFDAAPTGGANAAATSSITSKVVAVNVTNAGAGYTGAPSVSFSGGGGSGALATSTINANNATLTITALGDLTVTNNAYSGPQATNAPFNQKTATRHYGFGATQGSGIVTIGGKTATVTSWTDSKITVQIPSGVPNCAIQQQAQYGGSTALCGELAITADNGKQSIDAVTVTIGGKAPTRISATTPMTQNGPGSLQAAIDNAEPGDLIILEPGIYSEMILMWKPVRLQGVGATSSVIDANTQPEGKMDPWRQKVNCLFGLALNGQPVSGVSTTFPTGNPFDPSGNAGCGGWTGYNGGINNPQVDRIPLEGILGWDTTVNGNLAQLLQEPTLMGAYEGAGITVLGKGVNIPAGSANVFGSGSEASFPTGTTLLTNRDCGSGPGGSNKYPSNFQCNPSTIDGLSVRNSSQGGGGIFVHGWGHNLQIANNRVYNNSGTLTGGITVGQGESPDAYLLGDAGNADPGSCENGGPTGGQLPYCFNLNVNLHHNSVSLNSSIGDELYSSTPAGAGGVTMCIGADYYKLNYNWVCGNLSTGDGGGVVHLGFIKNGDIEHNSILFNQSTNPTVPTNGGGLLVMGAPPDGLTPTGLECGNTPADADCTPGLSDGSGPNLVINANLIQGNAAESGSGGGLRFQGINGTEVAAFPRTPSQWNSATVTNNIISNNVAGWDGAGVSMQDALNISLINNTIISNDTTASAGVLFNTLGAPVASSQGPTCVSNCGSTSTPQPAGIVTMQHSAVLASVLPASLTVTCPAGHGSGGTGNGGLTNGACKHMSYPLLANNVVWQNRAFYIGVGDPMGGLTNQQNQVALFNAFSNTPAPTQPQSDATVPNGSGAIITGGTGACVAPTGTPNYWDIGVRGDTGPANHASGYTLAPSFSVLTDAGDYPGLNNSASNPTVMSQYCNGSRTPPEFASMGYQVPPGISDATVPNPVFNLTPAATVDEGNNWINISWGPLALTNPVTGFSLSNYGPAAGSPVIGYIPNSAAANYNEAPNVDFYGNARKTNNAVDAGAVEYQLAPNTPLASITGGPLTFTGVAVGNTSSTQTLTLHSTGTAPLTGINVAVTGAGFSRSGGTCGTTLGTVGNPDATCTINVVFTPANTNASSGQVVVTSNVLVTGSPVALSGTGVAPIIGAVLAPGNWAPSQTRNCPGTGLGILACSLDPAQAFVLTNTGNVTLNSIGQATLGGNAANVANYTIVRALSTCGPAGNGQIAANTTLAPGASCTVTVQFKPLTSQATGIKAATVSVTDAAGTQTSTLNGNAR